MASYLEDMFTKGLVKHEFPVFVREYVFHPTRRWRYDFAHLETKIALEIEGGTHLRGKAKSRHTTAAGFQEDIVKYNEGAILGWTILRVTGDDVKSGRAYEWLYQLLIAKGVPGW